MFSSTNLAHLMILSTFFLIFKRVYDKKRNFFKSAEKEKQIWIPIKIEGLRNKALPTPPQSHSTPPQTHSTSPTTNSLPTTNPLPNHKPLPTHTQHAKPILQKSHGTIAQPNTTKTFFTIDKLLLDAEWMSLTHPLYFIGLKYSLHNHFG